MEKLLFSDHHIWIAIEKNGMAKLGISDYAQKKLGAIVFVNLPEAGEVLSKGEGFGDVESIKTVSDLISPISGEVVAVNENILDAPEEINSEPYSSWLITAKMDTNETDLMNAEEYAAYLEQL